MEQLKAKAQRWVLVFFPISVIYFCTENQVLHANICGDTVYGTSQSKQYQIIIIQTRDLCSA